MKSIYIYAVLYFLVSCSLSAPLFDPSIEIIPTKNNSTTRVTFGSCN
jgi:hypothetical protein